jgi:regulator of nucleoside diphosphate kinase
MPAKIVASKKPSIHISDVDYDRIADLALRLEHSNPKLARLVLDEIDRARVYPVSRLPKDAVAMGSNVEFVDDLSGVRRSVTLVFPHQADVETGRISVMTPVGAGLIGMRAGSAINWPCPDGRPRTLKILEVRQPVVR